MTTPTAPSKPAQPRPRRRKGPQARRARPPHSTAPAPTGSFSELGESLGALGSFAAPLLAVAAAGYAAKEAFEAFFEAAAETTKWNLEAGQLSRQLGITTEDASVLANSLEDHGVKIQTYATMSNAMTKALVNNSVGFKNLGVETKNSSMAR